MLDAQLDGSAQRKTMHLKRLVRRLVRNLDISHFSEPFRAEEADFEEPSKLPQQELNS